MLLLPVLFAASLSFSPLPEELPDTDSWEVTFDETFQRPLAADIVRLGALTLKFVQTRGVCPEDLRADCTYEVKHQLRRKMVEGKMAAFVQRFVLRGPTGATTEGLSYFHWKDGRPRIDLYFVKGTRWLSETERTMEYETAMDFSAMLAEHADALRLAPPF